MHNHSQDRKCWHGVAFAGSCAACIWTSGAVDSNDVILHVDSVSRWFIPLFLQFEAGFSPSVLWVTSMDFLHPSAIAKTTLDTVSPQLPRKYMKILKFCIFSSDWGRGFSDEKLVGWKMWIYNIFYCITSEWQQTSGSAKIFPQLVGCNSPDIRSLHPRSGRPQTTDFQRTSCLRSGRGNVCYQKKEMARAWVRRDIVPACVLSKFKSTSGLASSKLWLRNGLNIFQAYMLQFLNTQNSMFCDSFVNMFRRGVHGCNTSLDACECSRFSQEAL